MGRGVAGAWRRAALSAIADLLLPAVCPLCREQAGAELCAACCAALPRLHAPCPWCGMPNHEVPCRACDERGLPHLASVRVAFAYRAKLRRLLTEAKAGGRAAAVRAAAQLVPDPAGPVALVVPVPPAPGRRSGPHLATRAARVLARRLGVPCAALLACTRSAHPQHRLSRAERWRNTQDLYAARRDPPAEVALVDDILTSGATASAAAAALIARGARAVHGCFLARTL
ncbi:MAG: ComF family protein [Planctomycetota bacterium]|nr:ComF family protein [Planctomycetota bacterium]MCX8039565.1 ComF family protein [Planctomycetota bacterium]MDW8373825.1 ComF family protein [Planctomycetota bacterium]